MTHKISCPDCGRLCKGTAALAQHRKATHANPAWVASVAFKHKKPTAPRCPLCDSVATITDTKYGPRASCCGLWSWGMKPLADGDTHSARIAAHAAFDRLWKSGEMSRGTAYRRLQLATGMTSEECHISLMTADQARRVVVLVNAGALQERIDA